MKIPVARKFAEHMVPHVVRPARIIWNQIIGALFVVIAFPVLFRSYQSYESIAHQSDTPLILPLIELLFGLLLLYFGISSFLRARRLSRM